MQRFIRNKSHQLGAQHFRGSTSNFRQPSVALPAHGSTIGAGSTTLRVVSRQSWCLIRPGESGAAHAWLLDFLKSRRLSGSAGASPSRRWTVPLCCVDEGLVNLRESTGRNAHPTVAPRPFVQSGCCMRSMTGALIADQSRNSAAAMAIAP